MRQVASTHNSRTYTSIELLTILPSVQQGRIDDPATYTLMAAILRSREQLFNPYTGYDDGTFLELDVMIAPAARFATSCRQSFGFS